MCCYSVVATGPEARIYSMYDAMKVMRTETDTAAWVSAKHPTPSVHTGENAKDKPVGESDVRPPSRAQTYVFKKFSSTFKSEVTAKHDKTTSEAAWAANGQSPQ